MRTVFHSKLGNADLQTRVCVHNVIVINGVIVSDNRKSDFRRKTTTAERLA